MASMTELPIIDMGALRAQDPAATAAVGREIRAACTGVGFFYVANHGVPAAVIDGAGYFQLFWRIFFPLARPAVATFWVLQGVGVWNDYLVALIFLSQNPKSSPLTIQLVNLVTSKGQGTELLPAAAFISIIVPLIIFFSLQRYFVRGLLAGSVKG